MLAGVAGVAEMERDLLVERTQPGCTSKERRQTLGSPSKATAEQRADIIAKYAMDESVSMQARVYAVSRASILAIARNNQTLIILKYRIKFPSSFV